MYPLYSKPTLLAITFSATLLIAVSALVAWGTRRGKSYLAVGWLWYVGMMVPVIGLIQVGGQGMADRYMYLPAIGLYIMLVFGIADLTAAGRRCVADGHRCIRRSDRLHCINVSSGRLLA